MSYFGQSKHTLTTPFRYSMTIRTFSSEYTVSNCCNCNCIRMRIISIPLASEIRRPVPHLRRLTRAFAFKTPIQNPSKQEHSRTTLKRHTKRLSEEDPGRDLKAAPSRCGATVLTIGQPRRKMHFHRAATLSQASY